MTKRQRLLAADPCSYGAGEHDPGATRRAGHDHVRKRRIYERAGVREYWLVHPVDRMVTVYHMHSSEYGKPLVQELSGSTEVGILPGVNIAWDDLVARLPPLEI